MFRVASVASRRGAVAASRRGAFAARTMSAGSDLLYGVLTKELAAIQEAGTYKRERVITTEQSAEIRVAGGAGGCSTRVCVCVLLLLQ
jgi:hypothetical protein